MKSLALNSRKIELLLYCFIWLLVFAVPFFNERNLDQIDWKGLVGNWAHLVKYLAIFLLNVYLLVPRFLFMKRYRSYVAGTIVVIAFVLGMDTAIPHPVPRSSSEGSRSSDELMRVLPENPRKPPVMIFVDNIIIAILTIGAGTASKLVTKWLDEEKLRKDLEKEQLKTNLALLRQQVSPHFFMNTLNNIHALIDINTEDAKDAIVRLSTLMRYLLYDSAQGLVSLKKEIEFIRSFISLMQLRFSDKVRITVVLPEQIPDVQIPPMLFISLLENAFTHGVSYQAPSYINIEMAVLEHALLCSMKNSRHATKTSQNDEYSGIGLDNIRQSLNLLYNDEYKLSITELEHEFEVNLKIPI